MRYYHRPFFFPLVLILLTVLLAVFMMWAFGNESNIIQDSREARTSSIVDAEAYQAEVAQILQAFDEKFFTAENAEEQLSASQTALESLLNQRAPAEFKDLHLELVLALNEIQFTLQSEDRLLDAPLAVIESLQSRYPWLTP